MDKNAIKKYAVWARRELIARVSQKALQYGITDKDCGDPNADSINGTLLSSAEKKQRKALISQINEKGYEQVMEEVAYTWFNRFSALRFMEVNGYLPSHVRVFTDESNNFKPQIITEAIHLELDGLNMEKVYALKDENKTDELYKYLLITQCNALSSILPGMFQKIEDYTELLFPDNLLRDGSAIQQMIEIIPEDSFDIHSGDGQVEIIGWLYQYYNDEKKNTVISMKNSSVKKEDVPAATQLFTTDWVVRYIVDNSLGRYWIERNPSSDLCEQLDFFVTSKKQPLTFIEENVKPEDVTFFDPCMGSAHFGVYAFEVLMKIYVEYGYTEREAAKSIVENNLFGLDIDDRASQLANFAIMMKARQYDRRFLNRDIRPNFYSISDSRRIDSFVIDYFSNGNEKLKNDILSIVNDFKDAKEYGSIIRVNPVDFEALFQRFDEITEEINLAKELTMEELFPLVKVAQILSKRYSVVATNPPYLNKYSAKLKKYIVENYKDYSGDLFSVFMYRNFDFCKANGYSGFMTPYVWMFIKTFQKVREYIITSKSISSLIQMEYSAFEEATVPICSFVLRNGREQSDGLYIKLSSFRGGMAVQKIKVMEALSSMKCEYFYETPTKNFALIAASPIAFWAGNGTFNAYNQKRIADFYTVRNGISTGDNEKYLRLWYEVNSSIEYWKPCNKGGSYRKWYGNNEYVVFWKNDGNAIRTSLDDKGRIKARLGGIEYSFQEGIEMSRITSGSLGFRFSSPGFVYESSTNDVYQISEKKDLLTALGYFNSVVSCHFLDLMNPTINIMPEDLRGLPCLDIKGYQDNIQEIVRSNIEISQKDWDSFETSWDFTYHPLISVIAKNRVLFEDVANIDLAECFMAWENECNERFNQLKANEEKLNRTFIDIYGLQDELTPEVDDKDVTVRKADLQRDIKSLISYAVGCMFGRYSPEKPGLVYAGGDFEGVYDKFVPTNQNMSDYTHAELSNFSVGELQKPFYYLRETQNKPLFSFHVDVDNIIPICSDEYFTDDIVGRFVKFIETVYGKKSLDSNLKFIADALGGKGQPIDVIRSYFINDFYADHCKMYQKRPIYWQFDSGKKGGFKALIYMHRYQQDTIARMRTDYVHEQQARYRTEIEDLETRIASASTSEKVKMNKQLSALNDKATEIRQYEEKIHHLADQMIRIDLDDGVKNNYAIFQDVLAKIK